MLHMYLIMNKLQVYVPAKHIERTNIREGLSLYIRREREGKTEELSTLTERKMVWQNIWAPLFRHLWRDSLEHSHWKGKKHFSMSAISSKLFSSSESLSRGRQNVSYFGNVSIKYPAGPDPIHGYCESYVGMRSDWLIEVTLHISANQIL